MHNMRTLTLAERLCSLAIAPAYAKQHGWDNPFTHDGKGSGQIEQLKQVLVLTPMQDADFEGIRAVKKEETVTLRAEDKTTDWQ